jgi:hypothetical protein
MALAETTAGLAETLTALAERTAALAEMLTALAEKMDALAEMLTAVAENTDAVAEMLTALAENTATRFSGTCSNIGRREGRGAAEHTSTRSFTHSQRISMQKTQIKTLEAGRRVQAMLNSHPDSIGKAVTPKQRAELDTAVAQLATFQLTQGTSTQTAVGETALQKSQRQALYDDFLHPIAAIARRALLAVPEYPAFLKSSRDFRKTQFAADATIVADLVAKYEPQFIENGMPADFIARMRESIAALQSSEQSRGLSVGSRSGATAALIAAETELRNILKTLDIVFRTRIGADPALQADWKATKRILKPAVSPNPTGTPPVPAPVTPVVQPPAMPVTSGDASKTTPADQPPTPAGITTTPTKSTSTLS